MAARSAPARRLPRRTRAAAWLVTGPLGHLAAGLADWVVLCSRYLVARARGRDPWRPRD